MKRKQVEKQGAPEELEKEMEKTHTAHINKRLLVLKLTILDGMSSKTAGEIAGLHATSVNRILKRYQEEGIQIIVGKRHGYGHCYMTRTQETDFLRQFSTAVEAGQVIEVTQIHRAYEQTVGRPVTRAAIYYLLKRHHWRKVMQKSKYPHKASAEEIGAYKKNLPNYSLDAYEQEKTASDVSRRGWFWTDQ